MRKYAFVILALYALAARAQDNSIQIGGTLKDKIDGSAVIGATVLFVNIKDSTRSRYAISDGDGVFIVSHLEQAFYRIKVASLGYKPFTKIMRVASTVNMGIIALEPDTKVLDNVEIKAEVIAVEQIGDTTQYNAEAFKVNQDASAKDLVSKMPGIVVSSTGVTANGETIEQVLVDGKRFFGQDPLLSLNTLPANVVDKIQVYDEQSEQSKLTGFNDGNTTKTMNVITKVDKRNGEFGNAFAGYGEDEHYKAEVKLNSFKGDRRITLLGMSNNINQQSFSSQDIAGVANSRGGFQTTGASTMTGTQSGITTANSAGLNFNNTWNDKWSMEGSYFFNKTHNINEQETSRETQSTEQFYNATENSVTDNWNHRLDMRIYYDINEHNRLIFRPSLSYQNNQGDDYTLGATTQGSEEGDTLSQTNNDYVTKTEAYSFSNDLIYQHKFEKVGRTVSLDVNTDLEPQTSDNLYTDLAADSLIQYKTKVSNYTVGSTVTYTEPVGGYSQLSGIYSINYNYRDSDKKTYLLESGEDEKSFSEGLSNMFKSKYITQAPAISFATRKFGRFVDARLTYQHAQLQNDQTYPSVSSTDKVFNSVLPSVVGRMEFGENSDLFIRYQTSTTVPSVSQLQEVFNNSNPLFATIGNANLKQSYTHDFMARFGKNNTDKNWSIRNFTDVTATKNYLTTATTILEADSVIANGVTLQNGAQISQSVNAGGFSYWNVQNSTTYSFLLSPIKTNISTTLGLTYNRKPGYVDGAQNIANTYTGSLRVNFASNISQNIDFNLYYTTNANRVNYSLQTTSNTKYVTQTVGGTANLTFLKYFVFRNEVMYYNYKGVNSSYDTQYTLWNMSMARKVFKNKLGELELSVFDLLHQNKSVSQSVTTTYFQETRSKVLTRYFMLTFTYKFQYFHS